VSVDLPDSYAFAEKVPKAGASCATCSYLAKDKQCDNKYYQQEHGSRALGAKPSRWCCMAWTRLGKDG
jgi:hypothetical protein